MDESAMTSRPLAWTRVTVVPGDRRRSDSNRSDGSGDNSSRFCRAWRGNCADLRIGAGVNFRAPRFRRSVGGADIDGCAGNRGLGEQRHREVALGVADEVVHHPFRLRVIRMAEVRCEPVMSANLTSGFHGNLR